MRYLNTPVCIKMLLDCHALAYPERDNKSWNSPAGKEIRAWLQREGLVDLEWRTTARGKAWVEAIVNTPVPWAEEKEEPAFAQPRTMSEIVRQFGASVHSGRMVDIPLSQPDPDDLKGFPTCDTKSQDQDMLLDMNMRATANLGMKVERLEERVATSDKAFHQLFCDLNEVVSQLGDRVDAQLKALRDVDTAQAASLKGAHEKISELNDNFSEATLRREAVRKAKTHAEAEEARKVTKGPVITGSLEGGMKRHTVPAYSALLFALERLADACPKTGHLDAHHPLRKAWNEAHEMVSQLRHAETQGLNIREL